MVILLRQCFPQSPKNCVIFVKMSYGYRMALYLKITVLKIFNETALENNQMKKEVVGTKTEERKRKVIHVGVQIFGISTTHLPV